MINSRSKGNNFERALAQTFREKGWKTAVCSRAESKNTDDSGVDICFTPPFQVQAKAVERFGKHHEVLKGMPQNGSINIIFHKRNNKGTTVTMTEEDFWKLWGIRIYDWEEYLKPENMLLIGDNNKYCSQCKHLKHESGVCGGGDRGCNCFKEEE